MNAFGNKNIEAAAEGEHQFEMDHSLFYKCLRARIAVCALFVVLFIPLLLVLTRLVFHGDFLLGYVFLAASGYSLAVLGYLIVDQLGFYKSALVVLSKDYLVYTHKGFRGDRVVRLKYSDIMNVSSPRMYNIDVRTSNGLVRIYYIVNMMDLSEQIRRRAAGGLGGRP